MTQDIGLKRIFLLSKLLMLLHGYSGIGLFHTMPKTYGRRKDKRKDKGRKKMGEYAPATSNFHPLDHEGEVVVTGGV